MAALAKELAAVVEDTLAPLREARAVTHSALAVTQVGTVRSLANGVAWVDGLPGAAMEELVRLPGDALGMVLSIKADQIGVVLLHAGTGIEAGAEVYRTGRVADIPVGEKLLGRVIDPAGRPLDGRGPLLATERLPLEKEAPHILDRAPVQIPLQTGLKVIDALIPIGRGQRQLILGDRQTGKTAIAVDTILNQRGSGVLCIYCAIGQRGASLAKTLAELTARGAMEYTTVVIAEGGDAPGLRYIAPYAATTIGEYFMRQGRDVLVVYDDLTKHADTYREISLLLRRPPGREAFPGDIFYIHSRLLERATRLRPENGGGSLTALPIIQTEAQNIAAYIPTNLISITDGQVYLSPDIFQKGVLPAVDVGKSVSRVGGKAQLGGYQTIAGSLKLAYAQFEELEMFSRFGTRLDENTRQTLRHGRRIRSCLRQAQYHPLAVPDQIAVLLALNAGLFDTIPLDDMPRAEAAAIAAAGEAAPEVRNRLLGGQTLSQAEIDAVLQAIKQNLAGLEAKDGTDAGDSATQDPSGDRAAAGG